MGHQCLSFFRNFASFETVSQQQIRKARGFLPPQRRGVRSTAAIKTCFMCFPKYCSSIVGVGQLALDEALHHARSYILRQLHARRLKNSRNLCCRSLDHLQSIATCYRLARYTSQRLSPKLWQKIAVQFSALVFNPEKYLCSFRK